MSLVREEIFGVILVTNKLGIIGGSLQPSLNAHHRSINRKSAKLLPSMQPMFQRQPISSVWATFGQRMRGIWVRSGTTEMRNNDGDVELALGPSVPMLPPENSDA